MAVAEAQRKISSREFVEWLAIERIDGPGEPERSDLRMALVDWHLHQMLAGKRGPRVKLADLMLRFERGVPGDSAIGYANRRRAWIGAARRA